MNLHSCSSKTDYTNKFSIPKLSEKSPLQVSNINDDDRNNYQVTFTFMENPKLAEEQCKYEIGELKLMLIRN